MPRATLTEELKLIESIIAAHPVGIGPVSPEGAVIRDQVRLTLIHRRPVGYQRDFLEAYQPGETFYLPESLRGQLHEMGRTSANERPAGTYARDILGRLLVDLSWASSKLEGNTYSRLDTQNLIEDADERASLLPEGAVTLPAAI